MIPIMVRSSSNSENFPMLNRRTVLLPTMIGVLPHLGCWLTLVLGGWSKSGEALPCHGPPENYPAVELVALTLAGGILLDLWRHPQRRPWTGLLALLSLKLCAAWCQAPLLERLAMSTIDKAVQGTLLLLFVQWLVRASYPCCRATRPTTL